MVALHLLNSKNVVNNKLVRNLISYREYYTHNFL